jgi:hypothetical protein
MANTLGLYDPLFYAQEALPILYNRLGMAGRVYRALDRSPQDKGSIININRPGTFTAQDAPSTAQDITPDTTQLTLAYWKEVKVALTDKELTFTKEDIIRDHVAPMAYALANFLDTTLAGLYKDVPWSVTATSPAAVADLTNVRKVLFNNKADMDSAALMVDGTMESELLNLSAFSQHQGAGDTGVSTQQFGSLGRKFGMEVFASQNVATHTAGVSADSTGTLTGSHAAGLSSITIGAVTIGGTFKAGDTLVIAGNAQRYSITADATADGSGNAVLLITPKLVQTYAGASVVTITLQSGVQNLAFTRGAFALAMAPLTTIPSRLGAIVETVTDPVSRLALRSRMFYLGDTSKVYVALDILFGVKTLDPNQAVRLVD